MEVSEEEWNRYENRINVLIKELVALSIGDLE
jgi:hypothetical protein